MSPEDRAEAILAEFKTRLSMACACTGRHEGEPHCRCVVTRIEIIANAIREAEDEAIERVAQALAIVLADTANGIRRFKSPSPPKETT